MSHLFPAMTLTDGVVMGGHLHFPEGKLSLKEGSDASVVTWLVNDSRAKSHMSPS